MEIASTYYSSPLGTLELKATDDHIISILFCEQEGQGIGGNAMLHQCIAQLNDYFAGRRQSFDFPVQQTGTEFQQRVWRLLQDIPYGKTISYTELSRRYGDLKAIRAVASANGRNNLAIVVPCHRVIGSNATLTGYAGGLWRKQWLLDHERKHALGIEQSSLF